MWQKEEIIYAVIAKVFSNYSSEQLVVSLCGVQATGRSVSSLQQFLLGATIRWDLGLPCYMSERLSIRKDLLPQATVLLRGRLRT